ncbi:unnamed protein product [Microthlaspi erraticum]|uniref:Arabidopsis retrotransposon Orf1 C-terminal domain-containing protein n=1 Tax=Microthlaspi erraticum TaxID=1685480 RepID=A0A6D2KF38_9BRAS|nr:unnamed protein product [Microthlaspi erraticum]
MRGRRRGNQEIEESEHESNENVPMEEEESEEEEDELPMYQEHYDALFSMDFVETKYPHDDTMKALGIFDDVELVLKNMRLAKFFSYRLESYKELTWRKEGDYLQAVGDPLVSLMGREPIGISRRMSYKEYGLQLLRRITLLQVKGCSDQEPSAEICPQGLPTPSLQGKPLGQ